MSGDLAREARGRKRSDLLESENAELQRLIAEERRRSSDAQERDAAVINRLQNSEMRLSRHLVDLEAQLREERGTNPLDS